MSFTNGIGSGQQSFSLLAAASTNATTQADAVKQKDTTTLSEPIRQDAATLTSAGGLLAQAVSGSDTNTAKVAALQQAIAAGTYNVSASAVADKLIESLLR